MPGSPRTGRLKTTFHFIGAMDVHDCTNHRVRSGALCKLLRIELYEKVLAGKGTVPEFQEFSRITTGVAMGVEAVMSIDCSVGPA